MLEQENGHGVFNNLKLDSRKNIDLDNITKLLGLHWVKKIKNLKLTNKNVENLFGVKDANKKQVKINKKFLPANFFDNLNIFNKTKSTQPNAEGLFNKTFSASLKLYDKLKFKVNPLENKKMEKYESYKTKNFFFPSIEHLKLRKKNDMNVKKIFRNASSHLSTDMSSNTTKSNKKNKYALNQYNKTEDSLIKVDIHDDTGANILGSSSNLKSEINKYFVGAKKPNKPILSKNKIKQIFDRFDKNLTQEVDVKEEEKNSLSKISHDQVLEEYNKQMREIEEKERKLTKDNFFKNKKKYKENLEDYDPNAQLFDRTKYNNDIPQEEKHNRFLQALNKNNYQYNLVFNKKTKRALANDIKELIRDNKIRFFKQHNNKKNKNRKIFITALERSGVPFNQLSREIKKDIANNLRTDYLLRGGKDC